MADTHVTITGNLTDDPELKFTPNGHPVANFRLAVTARVKDGDTWRDGETSFFRVNVAAAGRARRRLPFQGRPGGGHRSAQEPQLGDPRGRQALGGRGRSRRGRPLAALGDRQARARQQRQGQGRVQRRAHLLSPEQQ